MGDIDANGTVNVSASDKSTGKKQSVTVRTSGGLSDADIERMVQEAEQMRESDEKRKDGETLCYQVEKQLSDLKEKISTADADDLKKKMEELRQVMSADGADPEEIKEKTKELQEASWKVTQQAYQQGSEEGGTDQANDGKSKEKEKK